MFTKVSKSGISLFSPSIFNQKKYDMTKCFETYIENLDIKKYSSALSLYPNPTNHIVHIAGENVANVKVFNKMGQLINNYNNTNRIDVSLYQTGIYIFNITTTKGEFGVYKVVVSK